MCVSEQRHPYEQSVVGEYYSFSRIVHVSKSRIINLFCMMMIMSGIKAIPLQVPHPEQQDAVLSQHRGRHSGSAHG